VHDLQEMRDCQTPGNGRGLLPSNPFYALRYHFGMLLGVDDFETEQSYHRGKMRLHNAWLHGEGVVWGFGVTVPTVPGDDALVGEIRVEPGLALDAAGRELHLAVPACVNVGAWFAEHRADAGFLFAESEAGDAVVFDAHVVIRFRACLTRAVPALAEPCDGAANDTAYSRALETVEILLRPGAAPDRPPAPYHRLRLLFQLAEPRLDDGGDPVAADQEVLDTLADIRGLDEADRPAAYLAAFRRFAALDQIELQPDTRAEGGTRLFPAYDDTEVVLADIAGIRLERDGDGWTLTAGDVDPGVRRSHVATSTIQELLCGALLGPGSAAGNGNGNGGAEADDGTDADDIDADDIDADEIEDEAADEAGAGAAPEPGAESEFIAVDAAATAHAESAGADEDAEGGTEPGAAETDMSAVSAGPVADAGGPRIDPATVTVRGQTIEMRATGSLTAASVRPRGFAISSYDRTDGWHELELSQVAYDRRRGTITIKLRHAPDGNLVRIIVRGTGERPLMNTNLVPLAGAVGGPPAGLHDGRDFVFMLKRR
jgi:hypothetical protein